MKTRKVSVTFTIDVPETVPLDRTQRAIEGIIRHEMTFANNLKITVTDEKTTKTPIQSSDKTVGSYIAADRAERNSSGG